MTEPVHVFYGGAHLFRPDIAEKIGGVALRALAGFSSPFRDQIAAKLKAEPVEDYRIDFEDGYGDRPPAEEDADARRCGRIVAAGTGLPAVGIRIKRHGLRTLEIFLDSAGAVPPGFRVTVPKVEHPDEVAQVAAACPGAHVEALIETAPVLRHLPEILADSLHLGPYDLLASLGIPAAFQHLHHPACTSVRLQMLLTGKPVVDGPTKLLPVGADPQAGWTRHREDILRSLSEGFYQSWDIHPAQLVSRYATLMEFYADHLPAVRERLANFEGAATRLGAQFDDASTVRGLRAFAARADHLLSR
jgi:citrate lyase beta subunit